MASVLEESSSSLLTLPDATYIIISKVVWTLLLPIPLSSIKALRGVWASVTLQSHKSSLTGCTLGPLLCCCTYDVGTSSRILRELELSLEMLPD
jgi:hypothetical protein